MFRVSAHVPRHCQSGLNRLNVRFPQVFFLVNFCQGWKRFVRHFSWQPGASAGGKGAHACSHARAHMRTRAHTHTHTHTNKHCPNPTTRVRQRTWRYTSTPNCTACTRSTRKLSPGRDPSRGPPHLATPPTARRGMPRIIVPL